MTINKDTIQDMMARGLEQYSVEELLPCKNYAEDQEDKAKHNAKIWKSTKDKLSDAIKDQMSDGEQLSLELDSVPYQIDRQLVDDIKLTDKEKFIAHCQVKGYTNFIELDARMTLVIQEYKAGTLPSDCLPFITVNQQVKMKFSKPKTKKGKKANGS